MLKNYQWPGNIRELQNIIERGVVLAPGSVLTLDPALLNPGASPRQVAVASATISGPPPTPLASPTTADKPEPESPSTLEEMERRHIVSVLEQAGWVIEGARGAARLLNLHPNTLRSRMKKLSIRRPTHEN